MEETRSNFNINNIYKYNIHKPMISHVRSIIILTRKTKLYRKYTTHTYTN